MTDTTINDAVVFPQDDGTGVSDGSEDYSSAAYFSALSKYQGYGSYVGEDNTGSATLQFNDVDTTNEQVDVGTGYAYITEGNHTVQSGSQTTYDTTIPIDTPYVVMLPSEVVDLGLGTDNVNDLWLAVDPTSNDSVYIRHGNGLSAPSDPSVKLGTVDTSNGDTTRANDFSTTSNKSVSTEALDVTDTATAERFVASGAELASRIILPQHGSEFPADGTAKIILDDGTGPFSEGDLYIRVALSDGSTKTIQITDFSTGSTA